MDLNRSVRILEDALSPHGRSLLRTGTPKKTSDLEKKKFFFDDENLDASIHRHSLEGGISTVDTSLRKALQSSTITGSALISAKPWENAADALYMEYLEVIQYRTNANEIFDIVSDLARCCTDTLNVISGLKSKVRTSFKTDETWLENERNTWRLIYCLYQDRLNSENVDGDFMPYLGVSEKLCVENLYKRDSLIRESQLIIDWLECNALDKENNDPKVQHFTDKTIGWENTLHQLKASDSIVFKSSRPIIQSLHPDAPYIEKLPLHDLDVEDELRLCKKIYREIRCGRLEEAQALCMHCGLPWRAALFEGWRLHHDPNLNYDKNKNSNTNNTTMEINDESDLSIEKIYDDSVRRNQKRAAPQVIKSIEGNAQRDVWKLIAWQYCLEEDISIHERAALAAFCGCLQSMLPVCTTWEDQLWAYMKTMVDIRVESEIRDFVPRKEYLQMPEAYWNNKMSLDNIFENIAISNDAEIKEAANSPDHIIQKYLILDQIPQLMLEIHGWICSNDINTQFLRFLAHLVLFLKQIGHSRRDDIADEVLESYVKRLMERNEAQLVAYYVATLGQHQQVQLFASFLERITDNEERKQALGYGEDAGLNMKSITKQVVENIRNQPELFDEYNTLQRTMTDKDQIKTDALDWVLFYPDQISDAIIQCNALISNFLTLGRVDAAKAAFSKVPPNAMDTLLSKPDDEIPESVQKSIKEHLSYKAYLDAHESFNDWFKYFHHSKPLAPAACPQNAKFPEKVAHDHQVSQHKAETERWKLTVSHLAKTAKTKLYNVLLFPDGGWLNDTGNAEHLRASCIPETVLLLYSVLSESGEHTECIQLADILAAEKYQLYKVYSKEKLEDIWKKCFESSIALLDEKKDMWGSYSSA